MLGNSQNPFEIDEARFADRMTYNRGEFLTRDTVHSLEDINVEVINNRNHGARVYSPWVFGLKIKTISVIFMLLDAIEKHSYCL